MKTHLIRKLKANETPPTHNNRSRGAGGVWAERGYLGSRWNMGISKRSKHHLANGTDVNVQDFDGWTPLHWAAMEGHKKIAELLIANGADVNLKNMDGNTPLQYAAMAGQIGIAKLLLIKEADLNTKNINDKRPLDVAIKLNHPETAALLRKHGAKTGEELKAEGK